MVRLMIRTGLLVLLSSAVWPPICSSSANSIVVFQESQQERNDEGHADSSTSATVVGSPDSQAVQDEATETETVTVKGLVYVNGENHINPVIRREGMKIFVDDVLARTVMTNAEEQERRRHFRATSFVQYVIESACDTAAAVAKAGASNQKIQDAWLGEFHQRLSEGPGKREPAQLDVLDADGLEISLRITKEGKPPSFESLRLLSAEDIEHEQPPLSDEEKVQSKFSRLVWDVQDNDLVVITNNCVYPATGETARAKLKYIEQVQRRLREGKPIVFRDYVRKLPEGLIRDLQKIYASGVSK